tara:strand:- start:303 stop:1055 length:753 start_codon:yes stop_codon:yes gene_type:complete
MNKFPEIGGHFEMIGSFDQNTSSDLQRTEKWLEQRKGRFTGSKIKDLMTCGRSTSKMAWGSFEKLIDFSKTAEKYIYQVGKERLTGLRSMNISSKQMQHGTENEPLFIQQLINDGVIVDFNELGFENFGSYKNGGASPDGIAFYKGEKVCLELKCCTSWDGHFKRMYEKVHEKHDDFWQFQSEMLATGTKKCLYAVAAPMQVEQYDIQIVNASEIHQKCILDRCKIADKAISLWSDHTYPEALQIACSEF